MPEAKPNVKAGQVECVNCHDLSQKQTIKNISVTCVGCHDDAHVEILHTWKKNIMASQKKTHDLLENASRKLNAARREKRDVAEAAELLDQGQKTYAFVVKANGIHNPDLALAILNQVQRDTKRIGDLLALPGTKNGK
jgi:formate-dependent nitrite reductase cytochrome c552 subunit